MVDIIDIVIAKGSTPQGQIETYARTSQQAVANANQAVATVEAAAEDIEEKQAAAKGGEPDNTKSVDVEMIKEHEKYEFLPITVDNSKKSRSIIKGVPKLNFDALKK